MVHLLMISLMMEWLSLWVISSLYLLLHRLIEILGRLRNVSDWVLIAMIHILLRNYILRLPIWLLLYLLVLNWMVVYLGLRLSLVEFRLITLVLILIVRTTWIHLILLCSNFKFF
jgi:hypothetical protein